MAELIAQARREGYEAARAQIVRFLRREGQEGLATEILYLKIDE